MREMVLIRHAETDMAGRFCGQSDPVVNERGYEQIRVLIESLREEQFDVIYTSDLKRALTTAKGLSRAFGAECEVRERLREIDFGAWEGLTWGEIEERDATYAARWLQEFPRLAAPGGEDFDSFRGRVREELRLLMDVAETKRVALVTHGGVLRVVLCDVMGVSEEAAWETTKEYCCVIRLAEVQA